MVLWDSRLGTVAWWDGLGRGLIEQHRQQLSTLLPAPNTAQLPSRAQLQLQQQQAYFASEDPNSPGSSSTSTPTWQYPRPAASSSRDAHNTLADIRQQYQHYQSERQDQEVKRELFLPPSQSQQLPPQLQNSMAYNADSKRASSSGSDPTLPHTVPRAAEDPMPSTSDFVKKLYKYVIFLPFHLSLFLSKRFLPSPSFASHSPPLPFVL
jgi:hypothetical protein